MGYEAVADSRDDRWAALTIATWVPVGTSRQKWWSGRSQTTTSAKPIRPRHMLVSFIVVVSWLSSLVKAMHSTRRSPAAQVSGLGSLQM